MRVLALTSADADPKIVVIDLETTTRLEAMQALVGGAVDFVRIDDDLDLMINDEMLLNGSHPTLVIVPHRRSIEPTLIVCGACAFVGHDGQGEHVDLTDEQIERVRSRFHRRRGLGWMNSESGESLPVFVEEV